MIKMREAEMLLGGVNSLWVSVRDLDQSLAFYRDYIGFPVIASGPLAPEVAALFKAPAGTRARVATLRGGLRRTALSLVEFTPGSPRRFREGTTAWDYGFYCLTYMVKDLERVHRELGARGFCFVAPPYRYQPNWVSWPVAELTLEGPDGVFINHFQRIKEEDYCVPGNYVRLDHCALMVESLAEARRFGEAVGLDCTGELDLPDGMIDQIIRLPPGTHTRVADWGLKDGTSAVLEFYEFSLKGRPVAGRLPGVGILGYELKVDDLGDTLARLNAAGFPTFSGPLSSSGRAQAAVAEGPGGVLALLKGNEG
jgi:catechol 2,3-dioxygenase-like lactoylglutathione lyase family enzyme